MLLKPTRADWHVIAHYVGRLLIGVGIFMLVPLITGIIFAEWNAALDFLVTVALTAAAGLFLVATFPETSDMTTAQGLTTVALTWLAAMLFGSIPLYLSGQYLSILDANFDSMSGFATTGLALIQDLDHTSHALNMWRHLTMFLGGQGIAVVALSILVRVSGAGGAFEIYSGEAREEKLVPNVVRTARFIWVISLAYLAIGILLLVPAFIQDGMGFSRSFLHSIWIFMAAWDTGGFAPQSQSILYYHSGLVEFVTILFMVGGTLSFGLHYALWNKSAGELWRNIEPRTLFLSIGLFSAIGMMGLVAATTYSGSSDLLRKGFYQLISAHTGTGYMTVYPSQLSLEWTALPLLVLMIVMGLGGSSSSTAGGIKALRVGLSFKAFVLEVRRLMAPPSSVYVGRFHHFQTKFMNDVLIRNAFLIIMAYVVTFFTGGAIGMLYGYPFVESLFESTSAAANVGLSAGITSAAMPDLLKIVYMFEMWVGRLEFLAVWALGGLLIASWRGR